MNKIAKKLFSAAVIVCLSISSVAAYAAQITPSSTSITLGKNDKDAIERYIKYYNEKRIKEKLGWMSPVEYRLNTLAA
jgi:transposase InsO family protein